MFVQLRKEISYLGFKCSIRGLKGMCDAARKDTGEMEAGEGLVETGEGVGALEKACRGRHRFGIKVSR